MRTSSSLPVRLACRALAALLPLMAGAAQAHTQQGETPPSFEVVTRYRALVDSATAAGRTVARLGATDGLAAEVQESARREAELRSLTATLLDTDFVRPERLSRVRDQALLEDQRLEGLQGRITERLDQLGALRARWLASQRFWRGWLAALRPDPDFDIVAAELRQGIALTESLLDQVATATTALLELQRRADELRVTTDEIGGTVAGIRAQRRQALLQRSEPVLFSPEHLRDLAGARLPERVLDDVARAPAWFAFFRHHAGALAALLVVLVFIGLFARRISRSADVDAAWAGLLQHPWALAVFTTCAITLQQTALAPPLVDVVLWAVLGATACVLAARLFADRGLRVAVYFLACFYPVFLLLEVLRVPVPAFRIVTAAAAVTAAAIFLAAARRSAPPRLPGRSSTSAASAASDASDDPDDELGSDLRRVWPLRTGALVWAAVAVGAVLGYDTAARWITHATATSAAVVFVVVLLVSLLRGALATLVRREAATSDTLGRVGLPLVQRLMLVMQLVLVAGAVLVLLDIWELAPSPLATWQRIADFGVTVGPVTLTVSRLLLGFIVVYFAFAVSWVIRTFVESEFYRRLDFDRGVGNTINTLVHYTLITLGVLFALAALGIELQNFAIVAGALGIGIGFGLQNIVNNFVSGLILLFERPVRVGDTVVVGGEWGTITKIGLRSTIMRTFDQSEMIVPNADLISEKVTNWTLSNPIARLIMPVGVAYGSDIPRVLEILQQAGTAHPAVLSEPPPQALFMGFGDSSLDFELRVWVREIRLRLEVQSVVLADIERRLSAADIEIPFPQRDLHLRSVATEVAETLKVQRG